MADIHPFGHEEPGVNAGMVLKIIGTLFGAVIVALIVLYFTTTNSPSLLGKHAQAVRRTAVVPPPPRLQPHPDADLLRLREEKRHKLSHYAWVGPAHHYAQIPIKRAMKLVVQHHEALQHARQQKGSKQ